MEEDDKQFGQTYKGQSYREWKNDTDEMDGDNDGCIGFYAIMIFIILTFTVGSLSDKKESKPTKAKTEKYDNSQLP